MRGAGAAHLPRDPTAHALRAERRALGRPRVRQGTAPRAAAGLPRGPVHVVPAHRPLAGRRAARQPAAAPGGGRPAAPRRRRPVRPAAQRGRPHAGASRCAGARRPTGCTCSTSRTTSGTPVYVHAKVAVIDDIWACVGSANLNRRSWSHDSELSAAVLDATRRRRASPPTRRASATAPAVRPRPAAEAACASTSTAATGATTGDPSTRDDARGRGQTPRPRPATRGTAAAGVGPRRRGRLRPHEPERLPLPDPAVGGARLPARLRPGRALARRAARRRVVAPR